MQLAVTAAITALFVLSPAVKGYVMGAPWVFATAFAGSLGLIVFMACSESARRQHPTNLICLAAFTLCEAVLVGAASAQYDTHIVLIAAAMTATITASLAAYAMQVGGRWVRGGGEVGGRSCGGGEGSRLALPAPASPAPPLIP